MTQSKSSDSPEASAEGSFGEILSEFEQAHHTEGQRVEGTVLSVTPELVFIDIGRKMDGVLPRDPAQEWKTGAKLLVSIRGRDEQGNYLLSTVREIGRASCRERV